MKNPPKWLKVLLVLVVLATLVVNGLLIAKFMRGQAPAPAPLPSAVQAPQASPLPSLTPAPTQTPLPSATPAPTLTFTPTLTPTPAEITLVGAGDIAVCDLPGSEGTARLIEALPQAVVFSLGDGSNEQATLKQYQTCFDPTWGRFKERIHPAAGNHDYVQPGAEGYYTYFGAAAGDPSKGYYSYDLGAWHIVVLNTNCGYVEGCRAGSPQELWLRSDLAQHPAQCTLAYGHEPRFSSGLHGRNDNLQALWQALYEANAELVISGHDHDYERFAPQDPSGALDLIRGIRQFVVGTGGAELRLPPGQFAEHSEKMFARSHGVLQLTLRPNSYAWAFVPADGAMQTDSGEALCH